MFTVDTPLGVFSQELTPEEQREVLWNFDEFFSEKGTIFAYPVHGGYMGRDATKLSFGKYYKYDALAPEFETYETIKQLAQGKALGVSPEEETAPEQFQLFQNRPNPFNSATTIPYELPSRSQGTLVICDILGRQIRTWDLSDHAPGPHAVHWDGRDSAGNRLPSGIYFCRLRINGRFSQTRKLVLLK